MSLLVSASCLGIRRVRGTEVRLADVPIFLVSRPCSSPSSRCRRYDFQGPFGPGLPLQRSFDVHNCRGQHQTRCLSRSSHRLLIHHPRGVPTRHGPRGPSISSDCREQGYPRSSRSDAFSQARRIHSIDSKHSTIRALISGSSCQSGNHV